ncbi:MAG: TIGR00730 family Rossman fold protein [Elusimicrobia bacterium]|nr:TIGR00730 family Rossman fold protein [Elusimicrobiota bacterium]
MNSNSINLIAQLKNAIRTYGPVKIRDYEDSIGGHFVAIDLAGQARWLDRIPELQPHEVYLIRKILKVTPDVQVVVREEGKTPDLVVAGDMTEIKSDFKGLPSAHLLDKANQQVREFAQRHMLEGGNLAMDLVNEPSVETQRVLEAVNNWAQAARRVDLGRIMMFAGDDVKHFALGSDGVFRLAEEASPGLVVDAGVEVRRAQMLAKKGMLGKAHDVLKRVMPDQAELAVDPYAPATQARESLEAERALLKIKKLARTQPAKARETWRRFRKNHSEEVVLKISAEVDNALGVVSVPRSASISLPADPGGLAREVSEPAKILRDHGVRATVTVYGSARILPQHVALKRYKKAAALWGENPAAEEGKAAMETARRDLENSRWYEEARRFGRLVAKGSGGTLAVVTGGGPGIMEAANRGAFEAGGPSVGYNIALPKEQGLNPYVTPGLSFEFGNFSTRKMNLRHGAAAYVFFPGGFGTMDELFETLTLMQTGKIARVPIVLVGEKAYWQKVVGFQAFADMGLIAQADLGIFRFAETAEAAWDFVSETLTAASPSFQTVQSF